MRSILHKTVLVFWSILLVTFFQEGRAAGLLGSELTYKCLSPDIYQVKLKLYYDCVLATPSNTVIINVSSPGCNTGRLVTLTQAGSIIQGNPYCTLIPQNCDSISRQNYLTATYQSTIDFSAFKQNCTDWVLSYTENNRARSANLTGSPFQNFYTEAYLNLAPGINNTSPEILSFSKTIAFAGVWQKNNLQCSVLETECDSLSYEMVPALSGPGVACAYKPINLPTGQFFVNPNPQWPYCNTCNPPKPQIGYLAGNHSTVYSPIYPLPSYNANWNAPGPNGVAVYEYFELNQTGEIRFQPAVHFNTPLVQGDNKYVVAVQVNEWRKVNNGFVKVGYIRREMTVIVEDILGYPEITNLRINNQAFAADSIIDLQPGHNLQLTFNTTDVDTQDVVSVESDVTNILSGSTFTTTSGTRPTATITWSGALVNNCHQIRYFHVTVKDNSCPVNNANTYTFGVRVSTNSSGFKAGTQSPVFTAFPNPFSQKVTFRINQPAPVKTIIIYNLMGQEMDRIPLPDGLPAGQEIIWERAARVPPGQYLAKLVGENAIQTIKFSKLQ